MISILDKGPLKISQDQGIAELAIDGSVAVGGGSMAGVVEAGGQGYVKVHELVLIDAGIKTLEAKALPAPMVPAVEALRLWLDAELVKI